MYMFTPLLMSASEHRPCIVCPKLEVNDWSLVSQYELGPVKQNVVVTGPPTLRVNVKCLAAACL